jgi:tight adherence protein B
VEQSGIPTKPMVVLLQATTLALILFVPVLFLTSYVIIPLLLALAGFAVPILRVFYARYKRLEKLRSQLPDAYSMMSRVMLAGQTSTQAMQLVSSEFPDPIAKEFGYCTEQQNLGLSAEIAMFSWHAGLGCWRFACLSWQRRYSAKLVEISPVFLRTCQK